MQPAPDPERAAACVGPGHAYRGTIAILARHAALIAAGDEWREMAKMMTNEGVAPESCATCRFKVDVDRWCGFWEPVPAPQPGEPAHYAAARAAATPVAS